jgi:aryl carrier-like protein
VELLLERGSGHNELTRCRYDVRVRVGAAAEREVPWRRWSEGERERIRAFLSDGSDNSAEILAVAGIPDARVARMVRQVELLDDGTGVSTAGELRAAAEGAGGVDPHELWQLARSSGHRVRISPSVAEPGRFDLLAAPGDVELPAAPPPPATEPPTPPFANPPASGERSGATLGRARLAAELRARLADLLPDYMVPDRIAVVDRFPLSPTGKVDRRALAEVVDGTEAGAPAADGPRAAPRSGVEERIAGLWRELLELGEVGRDDNFFDLGGNSFLVIKLQDRIRKKLGIEVAVTRFFEHPTIRQLAEHLEPEPARDGGGEAGEPGLEPSGGDALDLAPFRARAAKRRRRRRRAR